MSRGHPDALVAIALKLAAVLAMVVMGALVKAATTTVPAGEAVFFRSLFAMPVIFAWLAWEGRLATGLRVVSARDHAIRGLLGTTAMFASFVGLSLLPLAEVKALQFATPILVVVFAAALLGERVGPVRGAAVVLGLAGVLIILWPNLGGAAAAARAPGALVVLAGATIAALSQVHIRRMVATEEASAIVFWFSATASVASLATWGLGGLVSGSVLAPWRLPGAGDLARLVAAGLAGGAGQILLTSAYRFGDASVVAPFDYAALLFAAVIGFAVFGELPSWWTLGGGVVVIAAGVLIIRRERQLRLERGRARRAATTYG